MAAATESHTPVEWDAASENPVLRYEMNGQRHEVWFLDGVTALNHIVDVNEWGFRGVGLWRLGAEDPGLWKVLQRESWPSATAVPSGLDQLEASKQTPRHYGEGEVLRIAETPHGGTRVVKPPPDDQSEFSETYTKYPTPFVVEHNGDPEGKVLCLTFDDGPDPEFTPQILDILKARHVPATFFVIGVNAENNPGLIRREYAEGHAIGNHTYTHPNIALTSPRRTELELSMTQRIVENLLGVSTTFFRPPYNADSEPETPEELEPIRRAQDYGYATVAETIDPRDWEPGINPQAILDEIQNEISNGHIILLHDAGGDRAGTVAALPQIIDRYLGEGYRFATVGDLIGRTRAQIMPRPAARELEMARIEGKALDAKARFFQTLAILFLAAIYLTLARSVLFWRSRRSRNSGKTDPI